jgi:hypothetical protein
LDPGVVGLVDERRDFLGRLIEELGDRGGDDHPDREVEFPGGAAEFGQ